MRPVLVSVHHHHEISLVRDRPVNGGRIVRLAPLDGDRRDLRIQRGNLAETGSERAIIEAARDPSAVRFAIDALSAIVSVPFITSTLPVAGDREPSGVECSKTYSRGSRTRLYNDPNTADRREITDSSIALVVYRGRVSAVLP